MKITHVALIVLTALFGHYTLGTHHHTQRLELLIQLSDKARQIESETIRDLMYANRRLEEQNESAKNSAYVSGVVATLNQPDHYNEIWHNGYNRGTEVQILADATKPTEKEIETLPVTLPKK